jgi:DIS3-like exonuclease 1
MDAKTCKVLDTWFGRSIIRSSCEMEYEQAQQLLDGKQVATGLGKRGKKNEEKVVLQVFI